MAGPLTKVNTIMASINLDIGRKLNWGKDITLELLVPDQEVTGGLRIERTLTKGFDRVALDETVRGDGRTVIYQIADKADDLIELLNASGIHVRADGLLSEVQEIGKLAPNEPRVYTITCKTRTLVADFDKR